VFRQILGEGVAIGETQVTREASAHFEPARVALLAGALSRVRSSRKSKGRSGDQGRITDRIRRNLIQVGVVEEVERCAFRFQSSLLAANKARIG
jgi:hypothetical protein